MRAHGILSVLVPGDTEVAMGAICRVVPVTHTAGSYAVTSVVQRMPTSARSRGATSAAMRRWGDGIATLDGIANSPTLPQR